MGHFRVHYCLKEKTLARPCQLIASGNGGLSMDLCFKRSQKSWFYMEIHSFLVLAWIFVNHCTGQIKHIFRWNPTYGSQL